MRHPAGTASRYGKHRRLDGLGSSDGRRSPQQFRIAARISAFAPRALTTESGTNLRCIAFRVRIFPEIIEL